MLCWLISHGPPLFSSVLVDDFDYMTRQRKLTMLPSRYTVEVNNNTN